MLARDANGQIMQNTPMQPAIAVQEVTTGAASAQSAALNANTRLVMLTATAACRVIFGTAPTALSTSTYIPAGQTMFFGVPQGASYKIAAIQEVGAGKLSITEF